MFLERTQQRPDFDHSNHLSALPSLGILFHGLSNQITERMSAISRLLPKRKTIELWQSQSYADRLQEGWTHERVSEVIRIEVATFLQEYSGFFAKKTFQYGVGGVLNAYPEPMSFSGRRWVESRKAENKSTHRAELDTAAMEYFEQWLHSAPTGSSLVLVSPRDTAAEGYHGTQQKHYVFINHYTKVTESEATFTQYMSFDTNQQLIALQRNLSEMAGNQAHTIPANVRVHRPEDSILCTAVHARHGLALEQLESLVYAHEDRWPIRLHDLPQVDMQAYELQVERVTAFCLEEAHTLLTHSPELFSHHYTQLISIVKDAFSKWVEDHATNYTPNKTLSQSGEHQLTAPYNIPLNRIREQWQLKTTHQLTAQQKASLRQMSEVFRLSPLTPLSKLASVGHCAAGTPLSLLKPGVLNNPAFSLPLQPGVLISKEHLAQFIGSSEAEQWHPGECVQCNRQMPLVGPCSICTECDPRIPSVRIPEIPKQITDVVAQLPKAVQPEAQKLIQHISTELLRPSVSIDGWINDDYTQPVASPNHPLYRLRTQLQKAHNPLATLRTIAEQLSPSTTNRSAGSGATFIFPPNVPPEQARSTPSNTAQEVA